MHHGLKTLLRLLPWLLIVTVAWPARAADQAALGAAPGERLDFSIHWMGMPAGKARLEMTRPGAGRYALTALVETVALVKMLHPIEDRLEVTGLLSPDGLRSEHYLKDQRSGSKRKKTVYRFDRAGKQVERIRNDREKLTMADAPDAVNDPLSGFYGLRAWPDLPAGATMKWPVVDGKKIYDVTVRVGGVDRINTPLGWFRAFPVEVDVKNSDLFRQQGAITVWLTDDARRLPVQMSSWVKFGRIAADLVSFDDGRGERREVQWEEKR